MTTIAFENPKVFDVALARNGAHDMRSALEFVRDKGQTAFNKVMTAKTVGKMVLEYGRFLGAWHSSGLFATWEMHFSGLKMDEQWDGKVFVAASGIKTRLNTARGIIDGTSHWIAIPHTENTRRRLSTLLVRVLAEIDGAIHGCGKLEGEGE